MQRNAEHKKGGFMYIDKEKQPILYAVVEQLMKQSEDKLQEILVMLWQS